MRIGLKKARELKNFTVAEIADVLGISASFYYKIESGVRNPTINLAKRMAEVLGDTVDNIFFENELDDSPNLKPTGTSD